MKQKTLNNIDLKIILELSDNNFSVSELVSKVGIAYKNIIPHIKKLQELNIIKVIDNGVGRRKEIILIIDKNIKLLDFIGSLK